MESKNQFIEILLKNYDKFTWTRDNFEFSTKIGDYLVVLDNGRNGTFLIVSNTDANGELFQYVADANDNESVREIYRGAYESWNKQREESFWNCATMSLAKEVVNKR